jgi:hypothetical protein
MLPICHRLVTCSGFTFKARVWNSISVNNWSLPLCDLLVVMNIAVIEWMFSLLEIRMKCCTQFYMNCKFVCCWWQLPFAVHIIKHPYEVDGKSTAAHAAVLAPTDVTVFQFPEIPDYNNSRNVSGVKYCIYPWLNTNQVLMLCNKPEAACLM